MWCYFHFPWNCFIDYFDDPVPGGAVIYTDDVPFHYNEQEDTYTEFLGNPTDNIFLASSRDHKILLSYKGYVSNVLKIKHIYIIKFCQNSISLIQIASPIPSDLSHPTYNARKWISIIRGQS